MCADRDGVSARRVRRGEEEVQHRDGAHHLSVSAVSGRTHHRPGFKHGELHRQSAAQVKTRLLINLTLGERVFTQHKMQMATEAYNAAEDGGFKLWAKHCSLSVLINISLAHSSHY